jgi:hypothetical protein
MSDRFDRPRRPYDAEDGYDDRHHPSEDRYDDSYDDPNTPYDGRRGVGDEDDRRRRAAPAA